MNYQELGDKIIQAVGGENNVKFLVHCMTRLRFSLKDEHKADDEKVKNIAGVLGLAKNGGQYQVIIGNEVDKVYNEIIKKYKINGQGEVAEDFKAKEKLTFKTAVLKVLETITGIMTPLIPALAASGMLKVILQVVLMFGWVAKTDSTYQILSLISDATFYFMPMLTAYSAAVKFKTNPILALVFSGVLLHPAFIEMVEKGAPISFIHIPVDLVSYSSTIIPSILMVWLMSYVEKLADWLSPSVVKVFLKPLLMMLIVVPITLIIIGPSGNIVGQWIADVATYSYKHFGWITVAVLGATLPFFVLTGMNRVISPVSIQIMTSLGYEPLFRVAYTGSNLSQGAASLAVAFKTKNKELRQVALSAATTALLSGITEPALFGVTTKLKRPLIACSISGGLAGAYAGLVGVKAFAYATPGLLSLPMFIGPEPKFIINAVITAAIGIIGAFVLTLLIGFEDIPNPNEDEGKVIENPKDTIISKKVEINAPVQGKVMSLSEVPDPAFSTGALGEGIAIEPTNDAIYSPVDGIVGAAYPTGHAFVLKSDEEVEILLHIGIDTVTLKGQYFDVKVANGDKIKKGDLLVTIDREKIKEAGLDLVVMLTFQNPSLISIEATPNKIIKADENLATLLLKN